MEISGIDKLKVNHALVVFLVIITCVFCPLSALLIIDYKLFFDVDLIKGLVAVTSFGVTQFAIVYIGNAITFSEKYFKNGVSNEASINVVFRNPLINTTVFLIIIYALVIPIIFTAKLELKQSLGLFMTGDSAMGITTFIEVIIISIRRNKQAKLSKPEA